MITKIRKILNLNIEPKTDGTMLATEISKSPAAEKKFSEYYKLFFDICYVEFGYRGLCAALPGLSELVETVISINDFSEMEISEISAALKSFELLITADDRFSRLPVQSENIMIFYLIVRRQQIINQDVTDGQRWKRLLLLGYLAMGRAIAESVRTQREFVENNLK